MTSTNVDFVLSICSRWGRGDFGSTAWAHPEIEFVIIEGPAQGRWRGVSGMAEGWANVLSAWDRWRTEAESYRELDGGRVLVVTRGMGRGKASGVETEHRGPTLFHLRDGKVTRLVAYPDHARALGELGLDPDSGSAA
jgi:ketosteroid isomerase-like protein